MVEATKPYLWFCDPWKALNHSKNSSRKPCGPNWDEEEEDDDEEEEKEEDEDEDEDDDDGDDALFIEITLIFFITFFFLRLIVLIFTYDYKGKDLSNKPDRAKMRPDCVSACIDHVTYMERQMDRQTEQ